MNDDRLYILMRTDMASMNPGKSVAQGCHAATKFIFDTIGKTKWNDRMMTWRGKRGFGTKICLGISSQEHLEFLVNEAKSHKFPSGLILDLTYPLRDGDTTHLIPVVTCGYIFGSATELDDILGDKQLMP